MYHKTRSITILDILSNLRLSVNYKKICKIKNELVETAKVMMKENGGVYIGVFRQLNGSNYYMSADHACNALKLQRIKLFSRIDLFDTV